MIKTQNLITLGFLFLFSALGFAQDRNDLKASLFGDIETAISKAQSEQANILSPTYFKKAKEKYEEALKDFEKRKKIESIQKKLMEARELINLAQETARIGKITFERVLKSREAALNAHATQYAKNEFENAERAFLSATKKLEQGDIRNAKKRVPDIDRLYQKAEILALKTSLLGTVKNLMKEARELDAQKYTPITFAKARQLLNEAESMLNTGFRTNTNIQDKIEAAELELKHAIFLTREIKRLKQDDKQWENFFLNRESIIEKIGKVLGFSPKFHEGLDKPLQNILSAVTALQNQNKELLKEVQQKYAIIDSLKKQLQSYIEKEQGLQAELQEKQLKLELKRRREELIQSVEKLFDPAEAIVLRKGNNLIIRLIGLTFPSGKATIEPQYFSLLTKVQQAIRKFSNISIIIEGHTDSIGDDRYNENLSYERALAIKQYLMANMGLDESRITAVGYGESRPIASNETEEGRAQNRRIDIIFVLSDEIL